MNIQEKLLEVQSKLKAPKSQYNSFGKYHYRNCEDILEGAKPLLKDVKATIRICDEIVQVGERIYIKATAIFTDTEKPDCEISNSAYAREEDSKKGMDASQVTGATSSYARKYALNGLLCIDDTKDADSQDNSKAEPKPTEKVPKGAPQSQDDVNFQKQCEDAEKQPITPIQVKTLLQRCTSSTVDLVKVCKTYKVTNIKDLSGKQLSNINEHWEQICKVCAKE